MADQPSPEEAMADYIGCACDEKDKHILALVEGAQNAGVMHYQCDKCAWIGNPGDFGKRCTTCGGTCRPVFYDNREPATSNALAANKRVAELEADLPRVKNIEAEIARLREVITTMRAEAKTLGFDFHRIAEAVLGDIHEGEATADDVLKFLKELNDLHNYDCDRAVTLGVKVKELEAHDLKDISEQLRTQDNRITADPMFCVQEKMRDYGYAPSWAEGHVWIDYEHDGGEVDEDTPGATKVGYKDRWESIRAFFTEKAANDYIRSMRHRHGEMRTYVEAYLRCHEMLRIRAWLMANGKD